MKSFICFFFAGMLLAGLLPKSQAQDLTRSGFVLSNLKIPSGEIRSGGPPKDGIPAIDLPEFVSADKAGFIKDEDYVLGVIHNGMAKAYPIFIMDWHEIVNDDFSGAPVVISYCPLCGSGMAFSANIKGKRTAFGVSGLLYNSDVLLYDRSTESLWSQIKMQAISGLCSGQVLELLPTVFTSWGQWKKDFPHSLILTKNTGHSRNYDRNPYAGYERMPSLMFPVTQKSDRFPNKEKVLGLNIKGHFKAYPFSTLNKKKSRLITDLFQGEKITIHFDPIRQTARASGENGKLLPATTMYWFAWYAFHPETAIFK